MQELGAGHTIEELEVDEEPLPAIRHPQLGDPKTVYRYVDEHGALVFVVCRFEPGQRRDDGTFERKTFRQARLDRGRWVWDLKGVERKPLYRLPDVLAHVRAGRAEPVYVTAGEKDAEALRAHGCVATCNPMGEGPGKWLDEHTAALAGARAVTICADYDDLAAPRLPAGAEPVRIGYAAAVNVYRNLAPVVATIDVVRALEGKDPHDHLAAGHTIHDLVPVTVEELELEGLQPRDRFTRAGKPPRPPLAVVAGHGAAPRSYPLTDLGNAERLVDGHGDDLRYVPQIGWHAWDGRRWVPDSDGEAERRAKQTVRAIAKQAFDQAGDAREKLLKHALRSEAAGRLEAMVKLARTETELVCHLDRLDRDPYQLNVWNGTLDLATGRRADHDRGDLITKLAPVDHDPDADCPTWRRFLDTIFDRDRDLIAFVQKAVGYTLTGDTGEQVLFLLHGRGANGKTTFLELVRAMLGDYAQQAPAEMLMQQSRARGGATPDLARLPGARFVGAVETGEGRRIDEPLVKQLTGGDLITARPLYKNPFEFRPTHKLWLATNHLPQIAGTDDAIWRRIRLIPFKVTIPEHERDPQLPHRLRAELPGILNWALDGCAAFLAEGLGKPAAVDEATEAYRADMDELGAFIDDMCDVDDGGSVGAKELLTLYGYWATANNAAPVTANQLARALVERGFQKHRLNTGVVYRGLRINTADQENLN